MIHECLIDSSLNRLSAQFDRLVVVRPPATAAELAELEGMVGTLPRDLTIFLSTCNGLRVDLSATASDQHICCIHEIERMLDTTANPAAWVGVIPLRGLPETAMDWLVVQRGPAYGRVIHWHPWSCGASVLASGFGPYFSAWVDYLISHFDARGRPRSKARLVRFDASLVAKTDEALPGLQADEELQRWLRDLDLVVPSGADFE